jgi:hypothetical protein
MATTDIINPILQFAKLADKKVNCHQPDIIVIGRMQALGMQHS